MREVVEKGLIGEGQGKLGKRPVVKIFCLCFSSRLSGEKGDHETGYEIVWRRGGDTFCGQST